MSPRPLAPGLVDETWSAWTAQTTVTDAALLASALFLQRFSLSFGHSLLDLTVIPIFLIMAYQFFAARLIIDYDRLLWFLALAFAATSSLALNFHSTMLPSYCLFLVLYFMMTMRRFTSSYRYRRTLQTFQYFAVLIAIIAGFQFAAQFIIDGKALIRFYGVFSKSLFTDRWNTIIPLTAGSSLIKSNGIFLVEPSVLSQLMGLGIVIEIVAFRRLRYLLLLTLGLLLAYSGTGLVLVLGLLPLIALRYRQARWPTLALLGFAVALFATRTIDLSAFSGRIGEFENTGASGFARFISPFWLLQQQLDAAPLRTILFGAGPGTADAFSSSFWYNGFDETWLKLFYEYGLIGFTIFFLFIVRCLRNSLTPIPVVVGLLTIYIFLGDQLLNTAFLTIMMILVTLNTASVPAGVTDRTRSLPLPVPDKGLARPTVNLEKPYAGPVVGFLRSR